MNSFEFEKVKNLIISNSMKLQSVNDKKTLIEMKEFIEYLIKDMKGDD